MNSTLDFTSAWLEAIHRATACLRQRRTNKSNEQHRRGGDRGGGGFQPSRHNHHSNHDNSGDNVDESLNYLILLETVLLEHQLFWDQSPTIPPPEWTVSADPVVPLQGGMPQQQQQKLQHPNVITSPMTRYYSNGSDGGMGANPFATFQTEEDEDDEAGDQPIYVPPKPQHQQQQQQPQQNLPRGAAGGWVASMVLRRVMIRVVTSMSEVYAHKASACRQERPPKWKLGADTYGQSLFKIHQALQLADSEISRLMDQQQQQQQQGDGVTDDDCFDALVQDADIVEVAIQYLTQERDRYRQAAVSQEKYLLERLNPQWQARDQARTRMGDDKWVQNPAPKNDYWHRRRQDEYQLRDVQAALAQLNEVDTTVAQATSEQIKNRLKQQQRQRGRGSASQPHDNNNNRNTINDSTIGIIEQREQRYNGQRPLDYSTRVPWEDYPDPTNHGWMFTGSWEASLVEFFERVMGAEGEVVKLDWYYTTATMKTSLHHPTQGKTQMFANRVTPTVYLEILQNPRAHTNQRYQTRQHRPSNNNGNHNNSNNNGNGNGRSKRQSQNRRQPQQQR